MSRLLAQRALMASLVRPTNFRMYTTFNRVALARPANFFMPSMTMRLFSTQGKNELFVEDIQGLGEADFKAHFNGVADIQGINFFTPSANPGLTRAWVKFATAEAAA